MSAEEHGFAASKREAGVSPGKPAQNLADAARQGATARRNERLALIALAGMALGWGYNWVIMKSVLSYVGPFDFSALRTLFGAVLLLAVLAVLRKPMRIRAWPRVALLGVLQTGAFSALIQVALLHGGAGKTSILVYTMPFWVIPMAWVAFGERIRGLQWLALALAATGLVLILEPWTLHADFLSELLAVIAGLCWALATIVAKWIKRDHPMDALPLTAWQMLFGALALCLVAWFVPERPIDPAPYFYGALFYNAVIATALAWYLWLFALQHLSAGVAGMSALGVPVVGVLAGWLQLGEQPGGMELAGMVLIAVALVVISLRSMGKRS
ncbi:MAG: EamA family transporter [Castellaniella sp.]|nr:EamA family transporter [Castellaniella sp.]